MHLHFAPPLLLLIVLLGVTSQVLVVLCDRYDLVRQGSVMLEKNCPHRGHGNCAHFMDRDSALVGTGYDNFQWGSTFTVTLFVYYDYSTYDADFIYFGSGGCDKPWQIHSNRDSLIGCFRTDQCQNCDCSLTAGAPSALWHHLALRYDGQTSAIYIDGHLVASKPQIGDISTTDSTLIISSYYVSDVRFFTRALSAADILLLSNVNSTLPPSIDVGLVAKYDFSDVQDIGANHACATPFTINSVSPSVGGTDLRGEVLTVVGSQFPTTSPLTISIGKTAVGSLLSVSPDGTQALFNVSGPVACGNNDVTVINGACTATMESGYIAEGETILQLQPADVPVHQKSSVFAKMGCFSVVVNEIVVCRINGVNSIGTAVKEGVNCSVSMSTIGTFDFTVSPNSGDFFSKPATLTVYGTPQINNIAPAWILDSAVAQTLTIIGSSFVASLSPMCLFTMGTTVATQKLICVNSTFGLCHVPFSPVMENLTVQIAEGQLTSLPAQIVVVVGPAAPETTTVTGTCLASSCMFGVYQKFVVVARDSVGVELHRGGDKIQASCQSPLSCGVFNVIDCANGSYVISFLPMSIGQVAISVTINSDDISSTPLNVVIRPPAATNFTPKIVDVRYLTPVTVIGNGFLSCAAQKMSCVLQPDGASGNITTSAQVLSDTSVVCLLQNASQLPDSGTYNLILHLSGVDVVVDSGTQLALVGISVMSVAPTTIVSNSTPKTITVRGNGFALFDVPSTVACLFGPHASSGTAIDDTTILCDVPNLLAQSVPLLLQFSALSHSINTNFTIEFIADGGTAVKQKIRRGGRDDHRQREKFGSRNQ